MVYREVGTRQRAALIFGCHKTPCVSCSLSEAGGAGEIDRDELRHTAFGHRDAEQAVDARHRDAVVGDHQKACAGRVGDFA
jgi:hypothetical protein